MSDRIHVNTLPLKAHRSDWSRQKQASCRRDLERSSRTLSQECPLPESIFELFTVLVYCQLARSRLAARALNMKVSVSQPVPGESQTDQNAGRPRLLALLKRGPSLRSLTDAAQSPSPRRGDAPRMICSWGNGRKEPRPRAPRFRDRAILREKKVIFSGRPIHPEVCSKPVNLSPEATHGRAGRPPRSSRWSLKVS